MTPSPGILLDAFQLQPEAAIAFLRKKGLAITGRWTDMLRDQHSRAFTVAGIEKLDILQDIRNAVDTATASGQTYQQFAKGLKPLLQAKGWWGEKVNPETGEITQQGSPRRLKTIYETNLQTQYSAGRWQGQQATIATRPYGQYMSIIDSHTTKGCRDLNGIVLLLTDPFWKRFYPPNHWGCRARVRTLSDREVSRDKLHPIDSDGRIEEKETDIGGVKVRASGFQLPSGRVYWTDPGWDYNPGLTDYRPDMDKYDPDLVKAAKKVSAPVGIDLKKLPKDASGSASEGSLTERFPVRKASDVEPLLQAFHAENPTVLPHGVKSVEFTRASYLLATDGKGKFYVSAKPTDTGYNAKASLVSALKKIGRSDKLTYDEEYAVEGLWHEMLHNRQKGAEPVGKYGLASISNETLTQFLARHTYPDLLTRLGGSAAHQELVVGTGRGYRSWVANFRALLDHLGINERDAIGRLKHLHENAKTSTMPKSLAQELAVLAGRHETGSVDKTMACLREMARYRTTEEARLAYGKLLSSAGGR